MTSAPMQPRTVTTERRRHLGLLEIADLDIETIDQILTAELVRHRFDGTVAIDVPGHLSHVRTAVTEAVGRAGGRVVVTSWPLLWTDRNNPLGGQLRPPLRAAVIGGDHSVLDRARQHATVPIVNAGSDRECPLQVLADLCTIRDLLGRLRGASIAYVGGPGPYRTSLVHAAVRTGIDLVICSATTDTALIRLFDAARPFAELFGGSLTIVDPTRSVVNVDVIVGEPTPFGLFATSIHLPLERTGIAADGGATSSEGPRCLLFHRQENLREVVRKVLTVIA